MGKYVKRALPPRDDIKPKYLYAIIDNKNNEEMLCVGNIHEVSAYAGVSEHIIRQYISHTKKSGKKCKYIKLGLIEDFEDTEEGDEE